MGTTYDGASRASHLEKGRRSDMAKITKLRLLDTPCPVLLIEGDTDLISNIKFQCDCRWLVDFLDPDCKLGLSGSTFRGVCIDRLPQILRVGIDVDPADAHFYAARLDKAVEYGDVPKIVMALDPEKLDQTFREVPADTDPDEIAKLSKAFPTVIHSRDGSMLWMTKLADDDRRATRSYERDYARWIPGNPLEALRAVLIFSDAKSMHAILEILDNSNAYDYEVTNEGNQSVASSEVVPFNRTQKYSGAENEPMACRDRC